MMGGNLVNKTEPLVSILTLAAHEAVTSGYPEVTPAHLLIALSRASEEDVDAVAPTVRVTLRAEFEQIGLEPRRFRRRLRALLGNTGVQHNGETVHRSPTCRAVFVAAQRIAQEEKEPFDARHLVRAAFAALAGRDTGSEGDAAPAAAATPAEKTPHGVAKPRRADAPSARAPD